MIGAGFPHVWGLSGQHLDFPELGPLPESLRKDHDQATSLGKGHTFGAYFYEYGFDNDGVCHSEIDFSFSRPNWF